MKIVVDRTILGCGRPRRAGASSCSSPDWPRHPPAGPASATRKLPPARADFLAKVDYIISKEERKIFLELPDSGQGRIHR